MGLPFFACALLGASSDRHATARAKQLPHIFDDAHGTRFWNRCLFQSVRDDPIDQFVFVFLGGQMLEVGAHHCDAWAEPSKTQHCPCAAPSSLLGPQHTVVEIGANDGWHMSNSFFFEHYLGWRSLCIEPNPITYRRLVGNRPRCININALIGTPRATRPSSPQSGALATTHEDVVPFISISRPLGSEKAETKRDWETGLSGIEGVGHREIASLERAQEFARRNSYPFADQRLIANRTMLPLRPFASVFAQHGMRHIDVLFLDVEGAELGVLQSIDFDVVTIRVIVVEVIEHTGARAAIANDSVAPRHADRKALPEVAYFLQQRGYRQLGIYFRLGDHVFVHTHTRMHTQNARPVARNALSHLTEDEATPTFSVRATLGNAIRNAVGVLGIL